MKPEHLYYKEVNAKDGDYYRRWAASIGPYMAKLIDRILIAANHEEQAYNSCNGILHMCTNQSRLHLEELAKICVESNACRYSYFKKLLKNEANRNTEHSAVKTSLPEHDNLRGKEVYR
jgi:hypothetical protein